MATNLNNDFTQERATMCEILNQNYSAPGKNITMKTAIVSDVSTVIVYIRVNVQN